MRFSFFSTLVLGLGAALVSGQGKQNGENAITNPLGGVVNGETPLTITWNPSTSGTVSIVLLKGPPTNILDLDTIAANIANSGSFTWTVPKSLEDMGTMGADDRYAFKVVDDLTGDFEYSPPFQMMVPGSTFGGGAAPTTSEAQTTSSSSTRQSIPSTTVQQITTTSSRVSTEESTPTPETTPDTETTAPESTTTRSRSSATSEPSSDNSSESGPALSQTVLIAIIAAAVVVLIATVIGCILCAKHKKRKQREAADRGSVFGELGVAKPTDIPINTLQGRPYTANSVHDPNNPFAEPKPGLYFSNNNNASAVSLGNPFAEPPKSRGGDFMDGYEPGQGYAVSTPGYSTRSPPRSRGNDYTSDGYNPYGNKF